MNQIAGIECICRNKMKSKDVNTASKCMHTIKRVCIAGTSERAVMSK